MTGWHSVRILSPSGMSDHVDGSLISQWATLSSHHECTLLQVGTHPGMILDNNNNNNNSHTINHLWGNLHRFIRVIGSIK